ncbi:MAG: bifunctional folylpolyglutamate synthase/dihydrofolate synthase [Eubacterium sp.]|nr:bifunctional folylpolyglutamate synthase/dihydrofolate synthase [Eubacterium sp.]
MDYKEARNYIKEKEKLGSVFGLDSIKELLKRLDNPEKCAPAIHIAGTNGKGSILAFVEETFVKSGMNVGRYISPTIYSYRERYRHNKEWASKEEIALAISSVKKHADAMIEEGLPSPTAFEIETAAAFWLYRYWNVDVMLIECGMGGRLDATNVLEEDVLNVLSSISLDHMNVLGKTLKEITREKLGIVRDKSTLITYPQCDEVMTEIMEYSVLHNVRLITVDKDELIINEESFHSASFTYRGEDYDISMGGEYQILNAITAIEVLKYFKNVCEEYIYMGLLTTQWDGRFTIASTKPLIIVDGAHNKDAWLRLRESVDKYFTNEKIVYIMGVFRDKEYEKMIEILSPTMKKVYTVQSDNPRAIPSEELAALFKEAGVDAESKKDVRLALDTALEEADEDTKIIVCGTLSITGNALKHLKVRS